MGEKQAENQCHCCDDNTVNNYRKWVGHTLWPLPLIFLPDLVIIGRRWYPDCELYIVRELQENHIQSLFLQTIWLLARLAKTNLSLCLSSLVCWSFSSSLDCWNWGLLRMRNRFSGMGGISSGRTVDVTTSSCSFISGLSSSALHMRNSLNKGNWSRLQLLALIKCRYLFFSFFFFTFLDFFFFFFLDSFSDSSDSEDESDELSESLELLELEDARALSFLAFLAVNKNSSLSIIILICLY